jgi:hypothetical protein
MVPAGQWSTTFTISTVPVSADTSAWISGTVRGTAKGATLVIKKP